MPGPVLARLAAGTALLTCAGLVVGCGADEEPLAAATSSTTHTTTVTSTRTTTVTPGPSLVTGGHPFTGLDQPPGPVLAAKVDNTAAARPQEGVAAADLVYVEEVEAGLTRLAAVFSSSLPPVVGPVRSARSSDVYILGNMGAIALASSGANEGVLAEVDASPLQAIGPGDGYRRDPGRRAPHDLMADPAAVLTRDPDPVAAQDIGLVFGEAPPGGDPAVRASYDWGAASIAVDWDAASGRWLQSMDGEVTTASGAPRHAPATVVFQAVTVRPSAYVDTTGAPSPEVVPVGTGEATVLRDGRAWRATWSRPETGSPTEFLTEAGGVLPFAPGPVWVVLIAAGQQPVVE